MKKELLLSKPKINDNLQIKHEDVKRNLESSSNNRTISKQDKFRTNMNQIQSKNNKNMLIANGFNYKIFAKEEMQFNKSAEKIPTTGLKIKYFELKLKIVDLTIFY